MTDLVTFGETMLRFSPPEGTRLETADEFDVRLGGAESNVAVAAASLGLDAVWLSKLARSPLGRRVVRGLRGHGVDPRVAWDDADDARVGTYYLEPGGRPRGTQVVYDRANAAITSVDADDLPTDVLAEASYVYTSGITPALSDDVAEATATLLSDAREAGATTAFDLNYRSKLWSHEEAAAAYESLFPDVDVLVTPRRDASAVLDRDGEPESVARGLADEFGFETVVITQGEHGAFGLHDGDAYDQPAYRADTLDPIGTGDAFVGGFLAKRCLGGSVADALAWGAATAALKRTTAGDLAVVTPEEVERVVAERGGGISR